MDIQTKDGILLRGIPDGTPEETIKARIEKIRTERSSPVQPEVQAEPASALVRGARGFASPFVGTVQRGADVLGGDIAKNYDQTASQFVQQNKKNAAGQLDVAGGIGQAINPINLLASRFGPTAAGAVMGATEPVDTTNGSNASQVAKNTLFDAAGGKAFNAIGSRLISPAMDAGKKALLDAGINLTPGQRGGAISKVIENVTEKVPLLGDLVKARKTEALEQWNQKLGNDVLSKIDETLPKGIAAGHDLLKHVGDVVSQKYDQVLSAGKVAVDKDLVTSVKNIQGMINKLPDIERKKATQLVDNYMIKPLQKTGQMAGEEVQQVVGQLRAMASKYNISKEPLDGEIGKILNEARQSLIGSFERNSPPKVGADYQKVRSAYADLVPLEDAAAKTKDGVFSPKEYLASIKKGAGRKGKAQGTLRNQQDAVSALDVLGQMPHRANYVEMATGSIIPAAGALAASGPTAATGAALAGAYTKPGMALVNALLNRRPEGAAQLRQYLEQQGGSSTAAMADALRQQVQ